MKLAVSSASFAEDLANGTLTHLEWLDLCASELETDGVLLDLRHFPRFDDDYLAQVKKTAVDLGLTVAGLAVAGIDECASGFAIAQALGAPLLALAAPRAGDDPAAWGSFSAQLKAAGTHAKQSNVPLALRNDPGTLCASGADLKQMVKDVDSSWVRYALDAVSLAALERSDALLLGTILGVCEVTDVDAFGRDGDPVATALVEGLRGYRGFVVVDRCDGRGGRDAFHHALGRLQARWAEARLGEQNPAAH